MSRIRANTNSFCAVALHSSVPVGGGAVVSPPPPPPPPPQATVASAAAIMIPTVLNLIIPVASLVRMRYRTLWVPNLSPPAPFFETSDPRLDVHVLHGEPAAAVLEGLPELGEASPVHRVDQIGGELRQRAEHEIVLEHILPGQRERRAVGHQIVVQQQVQVQRPR